MINCNTCYPDICKSYDIILDKYLINRMRIYSGRDNKCKIEWKCGDQTWENINIILEDTPLIIWNFRYRIGKWTPYKIKRINNMEYNVFFRNKKYKYKISKLKTLKWCQKNVKHLLIK